MTDLGYCRVSTRGQTLDQQTDALRAAGVLAGRIYSDVISGVKSARPGFTALRDYARPGDTVVVVRLDRLGRSLRHMVNTINELEGGGVNVRSLTEGIDMRTASGRAMSHMFMLMAQYEREIQRERVDQARAAVESRGGKWGRKSKLTAGQVQMMLAARNAGQSPGEIAASFGISRASLYRLTAGKPLAN